MRKYSREHFPIDAPYLAPYPDFGALAVTLVMILLLSIGVKESIRVNTTFAVISLGLALTIIVGGLPYVDFDNWALPADESISSQGGFFPFGVSGTLAACASCFFAFVGTDGITTSGEEAKDPRTAIPLATCLSLAMINVIYFFISSIVTLMVGF